MKVKTNIKGGQGYWDWRKAAGASMRAAAPDSTGVTTSAPGPGLPGGGVDVSGAADAVVGFFNPFARRGKHSGPGFWSSVPSGGAAHGDSPAYKAPEPTALKVPGALGQMAAASAAPMVPGIDPTKTYTVGQTTTGSYTPGLKHKPGYEAGIEKTMGAQAQAVEKASEAAALGEEKKAEIMWWRNQKLKLHEIDRKERHAKYDAKVAEFSAEMTAKREEIATAAELDAGRWFSSRSVGQKIALGLSAALQGFIQGYRGQQGPNPVLQMMERAIDRDLKVQERNYDRKRGELKDIQGAYGIFRQQGMDKDQAGLQTKIGILDNAKGQIEQVVANTNSEVVRQNGLRDAAVIEQRKEQLENQAYQQKQSRRTIRTTTKKASGAQLIASMKKAQGGGKDIGEKPKLVEQFQSRHQALGKLQTYQKMFNEASVLSAAGRPVPQSLVNRLKSMHGTLVSAMRGASESGVMTDPDFARWADEIPGWKTAVLANISKTVRGGARKTFQRHTESLLGKIDQDYRHFGPTYNLSRFRPDTIRLIRQSRLGQYKARAKK